MPPSTKREFCNHRLKMKKTISFSKQEIDGAKARGLALPDFAAVEFCVQCWSVNPQHDQLIGKVSSDTGRPAPLPVSGPGVERQP